MTARPLLPPQDFPQVRVGDIELTFDRRGSRDAPAILLIMGLAMPMLGWPDEMCDALVAEGFQVIRFDNRDAGRSSRVGTFQPSLAKVALRKLSGLAVNAPYTLSDMAADATGLLDHLAINRAHIVGASMGGMIAQRLALEHADRALSLTSIMSTTNQLRYGLPRSAVLKLLGRKPENSESARLAWSMRFWRTISSPGDPPSDDEMAADLTRWFQHAPDLSGDRRQLAAILAEKPRHHQLRELDTPTLVIHGLDDPLIDYRAGLATARAVRGARFAGLAGMGHDLRPRYLEPIVRLIADHARTA